MPVVQIEPLRVIGSPASGAVVAERLYAKISDAFTRFDTINVARHLAATAAEPRADYRLSGTIEYAGDDANAWFTLTSTRGKQSGLVAAPSSVCNRRAAAA